MADNKNDPAVKTPPTEPEVENPPVDPTVPSDTPPPDDDSSDEAAPCGDDEDREAHIGDEITDPWDDLHQKDWPKNEVSPA
jgi:hypothetical protein